MNFALRADILIQDATDDEREHLSEAFEDFLNSYKPHTGTGIEHQSLVENAQFENNEDVTKSQLVTVVSRLLSSIPEEDQRTHLVNVCGPAKALLARVNELKNR
ncbi:hypothetical protein [Reinekea sp. G2M2-21]|uniref:hypothetical protein n=1 Tax=Reinekea sp. G2M2-21 TaxID=2788942 RepID=UPI0018A9C756|nr:hypothetical protein [Reinekea sp. G2M2-21]